MTAISALERICNTPYKLQLDDGGCHQHQSPGQAVGTSPFLPSRYSRHRFAVIGPAQDGGVCKCDDANNEDRLPRCKESGKRQHWSVLPPDRLVTLMESWPMMLRSRTRPAMRRTTTVSQKVPVADTRAWRTGLRVWAARPRLGGTHARFIGKRLRAIPVPG